MPATFTACELERVYFSMLRIRRVEEAIAGRYGEQQMRCPVHLCIGQEAVAAGICALLERDDQVFSTHRAHGHYLAKGGSLNAMMAEIYGKATGCCKGMGGSMHLIDVQAGFLGAVPIVGSTIPLAVGAAWSAKLQGKQSICAVFFGDGAFEEGVMHEAMNFAALHRLPILFVCENNLYSVYTRLEERQPDRRIAEIAAAHGCATASIDGNDAQAIMKSAAPLVAALRRGDGPAFIEAHTYRWLEHCGHLDDDHLGYRPGGELERWRNRCPIALLGSHLLAGGTSGDTLAAMEEEIGIEIDKAFAAAIAAPPPTSDILAEYMP